MNTGSGDKENEQCRRSKFYCGIIYEVEKNSKNKINDWKYFFECDIFR